MVEVQHFAPSRHEFIDELRLAVGVSVNLGYSAQLRLRSEDQIGTRAVPLQFAALAVAPFELLAMACHCTGCQRMSVSAFSLSLAIPTPGFEVTAGEPVLGKLHGDSHHYFCPHCKSWMFTRTEGMDEFVNLRPSMLDAHGWFVPFAEPWTDEKLPWASTPAVHSFGRLPTMGAFPALIAAYAQQRARPSAPNAG